MIKKELIVAEPLDLKAITLRDVLENVIGKYIDLDVRDEEDLEILYDTTLYELFDSTNGALTNEINNIICKHYSSDTLKKFKKELSKLNIVKCKNSGDGYVYYSYGYMQTNLFEPQPDNESYGWLKEITFDKFKFYLEKYVYDWAEIYNDEFKKEFLKWVEINTPKNWTLFDMLCTYQWELCDSMFSDEDLTETFENILKFFNIRCVGVYNDIKQFKKGDIADEYIYCYVGPNIEYNKTIMDPDKYQVWKSKTENKYILLGDINDKFQHEINECKTICENNSYANNIFIKPINLDNKQFISGNDLLNNYEYVINVDPYGFPYGNNGIMMDVLMNN